jgi:hypothetical protein
MSCPEVFGAARRAVVEEPLLTENKAERDESPEAQPEPHTFPVRD